MIKVYVENLVKVLEKKEYYTSFNSRWFLCKLYSIILFVLICYQNSLKGVLLIILFTEIG